MRSLLSQTASHQAPAVQTDSAADGRGIRPVVAPSRGIHGLCSGRVLQYHEFVRPRRPAL